MNWLAQWSFDPSVVIGLVLAALLYWRGRHPHAGTRPAGRWRLLSVVSETRKAPPRLWHALSFYAGLAVIFVALESPIDALSAYLFSFHMIQHLLLIMVAAPLLLLGDPAVTLLRGIPLTLRRPALQSLARRSWVRQAVRRLSLLARPRSVFVIFTVDLYLWHWNWLFNLTLQYDAVHLLEHLCFLVTAILFWSQVINQRALHARLSYTQRAAYTVITAAASNFLAMYFVFTPKPLYTAYAHIAHRPFGMTALGDQQVAGAIMWVPVLFLFGGAFAVCLYKALGEDEGETSAVPPGETPYSMVGVSREL
jgi:cytochrome c oxidase assembly factor CtaG